MSCRTSCLGTFCPWDVLSCALSDTLIIPSIHFRFSSVLFSSSPLYLTSFSIDVYVISLRLYCISPPPPLSFSPTLSLLLLFFLFPSISPPSPLSLLHLFLLFPVKSPDIFQSSLVPTVHQNSQPDEFQKEEFFHVFASIVALYYIYTAKCWGAFGMTGGDMPGMPEVRL